MDLCASLQVRAGHGAGKPTKKIIEEAADSYGCVELHKFALDLRRSMMECLKKVPGCRPNVLIALFKNVHHLRGPIS